MSLSLQQVFDKVNAQEDPTMGYVYDAPIHYIVLNDDENSFDMDKLNKLLSLYE